MQMFMTWGRATGDSNNCGWYDKLCQFPTNQDRLTDSYKKFACFSQPSQIAPVRSEICI
jgi:hypothetical protein